MDLKRKEPSAMLCPLGGRARDCVSPWAWHGTLCSTDTLILTLLVKPGSRGDPYHLRGCDEIWGVGRPAMQPACPGLHPGCDLSPRGHGQASLRLHTCDTGGDDRTCPEGASEARWAGISDGEAAMQTVQWFPAKLKTEFADDPAIPLRVHLQPN